MLDGGRFLVGRDFGDRGTQFAAHVFHEHQGEHAGDGEDDGADAERQGVSVVDAFFAAARRGDFDALVTVLHPDVELRVDGGPQYPEASMLLRGSAAVARQAVMGIRQLLGGPAAGLRRVLVNGSAGVLVTLDGQPITLMSFTVAEGKITAIAGIADPGRVRRITCPFGRNGF